MSWESSGWHAPDGGPVGPPRVPAARRALLGSLRFEALEAHRQIPLAAVLGVRGLLQDASGLAQFNTLELRIAARHAGPALGQRFRPRAVGASLVERWHPASEPGSGLRDAELCVLSRAPLASARRARTGIRRRMPPHRRGPAPAGCPIRSGSTYPARAPRFRGPGRSDPRASSEADR